jgi:hypothetical protein
MTLIDTLHSYKRVIADLETASGTELLVAQLRRRAKEIKAEYRAEIEFELSELNASMARHPSQMNNGSPLPLVTIEDL